MKPSARSCATLRWTDGFSHMRLFIAGARIIGPWNANSSVLRQVVGQAQGRLGQQVGRGRGDAEQLGGVGQLDVRMGPGPEDVAGHGPAGEGLEGLGPDQPRGRLRSSPRETPAPACTSRLTRAAVL